MKSKRSLSIVVGTRPNFIKVTRFKAVALEMDDIEIEIIHTGQHYDHEMATVFFDQFGLQPDVFLGISKGKSFQQIAETIDKLGVHFEETKPDMVMVVGDVNSTLAAAVAANKCNIPISHLESGLRSFDNGMPEEHNRKVADQLSQLHFVTEDSGLKNLRNEGFSDHSLSFVGNTMIDTLVAFRDRIQSTEIDLKKVSDNEPYILVTIHRPSNVDSIEGLTLVRNILSDLTEYVTVVFSVHPRTRSRMESLELLESFEEMNRLEMLPPLSYFEFQRLISSSILVLTDSGGIQEETTYLQKPCLTLRPNTERPVTVDVGSNKLLPFERDSIVNEVKLILNGKGKRGEIPKLWDGKATERVLKRIADFLERGS